jgi:hypothetical protein
VPLVHGTDFRSALDKHHKEYDTKRGCLAAMLI